MSLIKKIYNYIKRIIKVFIRGIKYAWKEYHFLITPTKFKREINKTLQMIKLGDEYANIDPYDKTKYQLWIKYNEYHTKHMKYNYNPLISFIVTNIDDLKNLDKCLESIIKQTYKNIEICLVTNSNNRVINKDERIKIKYIDDNETDVNNIALKEAQGEYMAILNSNSIISKNTLREFINVLNEQDNTDIIYCDEDYLDRHNKRCNPHFKSDFAPDTLLSLNYIGNLCLVRTKLIKKVGGWDNKYKEYQDWDLFLKLTEKTNNIYHLPMILCHTFENNIIKDNRETRQILLEDTIKRRNVVGNIQVTELDYCNFIEYKYIKEPKISIIIPTKDYADTLNTCLKSIFNKTTYHNYEVIVVDNRSVEEKTFKLFKEYEKKYKNFRIVKADMEFNYSKINNLAVKEAQGEFLVLLNNDTEVISNNWLEIMVGYASQKHIGAVGAKLIYPDNTIQHGGVVLNYGGGVAGHIYSNYPKDAQGDYGRLVVPYNYAAVTAACLMISRKKYEEIKGLNEELKVAYNDVDFCLRLLKKGYYNIELPMVELYHFESKSRGQENTPEKLERFKKEENYMYSHWGDLISNDPFYNKNLSRLYSFKLRTDNKN